MDGDSDASTAAEALGAEASQRGVAPVDLRELNRRIRPDFDPLVPEVRDAYLAVQC